MDGIKCPVVQHRWLAIHGARWIYGLWYAKANRCDAAKEILAKFMRPPYEDEFPEICEPAYKGWLVGMRRYEPTPPDPRAVGRGGGFILSVAYVEKRERPSTEDQDDIRRKLNDLPVPETHGVNEKLIVEYFPPAKPSRRVPWVQLVLLLIGVALVLSAEYIGGQILRARGSGRSLTPLFAALGAVLMCVAVRLRWRWFAAPPESSADAAGQSDLDPDAELAPSTLAAPLPDRACEPGQVSDLGSVACVSAESPKDCARQLEAEWKKVYQLAEPIRPQLLAENWRGLLWAESGVPFIARPESLVSSKINKRPCIKFFPPIVMDDHKTVVFQDSSLLIIYGKDEDALTKPSSRAWLHVFHLHHDDWLWVFAVRLPDRATPTTPCPDPIDVQATMTLSEDSPPQTGTVEHGDT